MISHGEDKGKWTYALNYKWQEVTQQYSNLFFKVQGNKTEAFGKVQQQSAPRLTKIQEKYFDDNIEWKEHQLQELTLGEWTPYMHTGNNENLKSA